MRLKTFSIAACAGALVAAAILSPRVFAQSQMIQVSQPQPGSVYTYHGQMIAAPPESELTPVAARVVTSSELVVQHQSSVAYPDGDISEPVALDDAPAATHEASLVTTRKTYDREGRLLATREIDHVNDGVQQ